VFRTVARSVVRIEVQRAAEQPWGAGSSEAWAMTVARCSGGNARRAARTMRRQRRARAWGVEAARMRASRRRRCSAATRAALSTTLSASALIPRCDPSRAAGRAAPVVKRGGTALTALPVQHFRFAGAAALPMNGLEPDD
jgi:hypothetical protein